MNKTLGFLMAACLVAGGLALAQSSEPEIHAPRPSAPPVPETPEAPRPADTVTESVPETPAPARPGKPASPPAPARPDDPEPPAPLSIPAVLDTSGDWVQSSTPGVIA